MTNHASTRGSALLLVFWAVAVMSICVLGLMEYLYSDLDEVTSLKKDSRAYQLAESGIAIGLNPLVSRTDSVLKQKIAPGEGFEVHLRSEGGRLNINTVLQNKEWVVLQNLFLNWGVHEADVSNLVKAFQDWSVDALSAGPVAQTQAQPQPQAATPQMVRLFQSVDDMLSIPGMDAVADAKPDWRNYFTIWSDGTLDMNDAPAELIMAVCGGGMGRAEQFVNARLGPDGKPDTEDDLVFTTLDQVRAVLGMSQQDFAKIQGLLSVQDSTIRIESTGTCAKYQRTITAVARRNAVPPTFFQWQEL